VLGGFSQGAAVSLFTATTSDKDLAGFIGLSGYLPLHGQLGSSIPVRDTSKQKRIFMGHGTSDEVVKFQWGRDSSNWLREIGFEKVDFKVGCLVRSKSCLS
jgi:predicted esterase